MALQAGARGPTLGGLQCGGCLQTPVPQLVPVLLQPAPVLLQLVLVPVPVGLVPAPAHWLALMAALMAPALCVHSAEAWL